MADLETITVDKFKLLPILKKNREEHIKYYNKAQDIYRTKALKLLEERQKDFMVASKAGTVSPVDPDLSFLLLKPHFYIDEYDKVISKLEWSLDRRIELTQEEFNCFVHDSWSWQFGSLSMATGDYRTRYS